MIRRGRTFAGRQLRTARCDEPVHVLLDSTGLQVFGQDERDAEKHRCTPRRWRKLHLAVDAQTGEIVAHSLTDKDTGDIPETGCLLATVEGQIASVIADGAYDGVPVHYVAAALQRNPSPSIVIPPSASSIVNTDVQADTVRQCHVREIAEKGRMVWQKANGYGRRSIVETRIGRYKNITGPKPGARASADQNGEVAIAICALNQMIRTAKPISASAA